MPVGPLAVLDETSLSLSLHVMEQTQADFTAEGKTYTPSPGERVVQKLVKELNRPGRAGGGGFYEYPTDKGTKEIPLAAAQTPVRENRRQLEHRGPERPPAVPPGGGNRALP